MIRAIFDSKNHNGWLIAASAVAIFGMMCAVFIPAITTLTRFQLPTRVAFAPTQGALLFQLAAVLAIAAGLYFIYKFADRRKRVIGALSGIVLFAGFTYVAFHHYTYVDEAYIEVGTGTGQQQYSWDRVTALTSHRAADGVESFTLTMDDQREIETVFVGPLNSNVKKHIATKIEGHGVEIQYQP